MSATHPFLCSIALVGMCAVWLGDGTAFGSGSKTRGPVEGTRAREIGLVIGVLPPGHLKAIPVDCVTEISLRYGVIQP